MIECTSSKAVRNLQFSMCKSCTQLAPDEQLFEGQSQGWHELILQPSGPAASNFPLPAVSKYVQCPTVQTAKRMRVTKNQASNIQCRRYQTFIQIISTPWQFVLQLKAQECAHHLFPIHHTNDIAPRQITFIN